MNEYQALSSAVNELRRTASRIHDLSDDPIVGVPQIMSAHGGISSIVDMPDSQTHMTGIIQLAGLAHAMRHRLVSHELRAPVPEVVATTDLHSLPAAPPALLSTPWIVEVAHPQRESLFPGAYGKTVAVGAWQASPGAWYLFGLDYPDGFAAAKWSPVWGGREIKEGIQPVEETEFLDGLSSATHTDWAVNAARFAIVLGLLLEAANTPLRLVSEAPRIAGRRHGKSVAAREWAVRRIYLDGAGYRPLVDTPNVIASSHSTGIDKREPSTAKVTGHLKRQPYGPDRKERRWIYVAGYQARRWVAPRPVKVVVGVHG